ncbi:hypothetical protein RND81_01G095700 [Saponaria officinalis]|uniref:Uncharacterized protein n=1 Tax=Saponaria officinalis TaxID=3572 RepID=A0AAW1NFQ3_SAPOF
MTANVAAKDLVPTSMLIATSKQIGFRCCEEIVAFLKYKKKDPNPEKCRDKGREVTRCVFPRKRGKGELLAATYFAQSTYR